MSDIVPASHFDGKMHSLSFIRDGNLVDVRVLSPGSYTITPETNESITIVRGGIVMEGKRYFPLTHDELTFKRNVESTFRCDMTVVLLCDHRE